jgi:hypothetical protein
MRRQILPGARQNLPCPQRAVPLNSNKISASDFSFLLARALHIRRQA